MIVADTDLVSYLFIPGPRTPAAMTAYARDPYWCATANQSVELLNVVSKNIRKDLISLEAGVTAYQEAISSVERNFESPSNAELLALSKVLDTTTYDSAFVWLARKLNVRLVTGDAGLVRCAPDVAVSIEDFASGK